VLHLPNSLHSDRKNALSEAKLKLFLKGPLSYVGWLEVYLHLFLTSALNRSERSESPRRRLITGKEPPVTKSARDWRGGFAERVRTFWRRIIFYESVCEIINQLHPVLY